VIREVSDQTSLDLPMPLAPFLPYGFACGALTPTLSRQVSVVDNAERCQSGLPDDCIDAEPYPIGHTCAERPDSKTTPAQRAQIEHEFTRREVSERSIEAVVLKTVHVP